MAGAVGGGVGKGRQIHLVKNQQPHGEYHHIDHAPGGNGLAYLKINDQRQRDIDQQAQIAHADAADVLDHGADAVEPRGGEGVWKHEQLIVQRRQQSHRGDDKIGPYTFHFSLITSIICHILGTNLWKTAPTRI